MIKNDKTQIHTRRPHPQAGNAMVYILIALALIAALTATISSQNDQADGQDISEEQLGLYVNELTTYVANAQQIIDIMLSTGSHIEDLDFVTPDEAAFDTGSHIHKVFHPLGGGLNYEPTFSSAIQNGVGSGWAMGNDINVEWTPSANNDVLITAYFVSEQICQELNKRYTGSTTIPITASDHDGYFVSQDTDLDVAECADCDGLPTLCVENDTNDGYSFYSLIASQ